MVQAYTRPVREANSRFGHSYASKRQHQLPAILLGGQESLTLQELPRVLTCMRPGVHSLMAIRELHGRTLAPSGCHSSVLRIAQNGQLADVRVSVNDYASVSIDIDVAIMPRSNDVDAPTQVDNAAECVSDVPLTGSCGALFTRVIDEIAVREADSLCTLCPSRTPMLGGRRRRSPADDFHRSDVPLRCRTVMSLLGSLVHDEHIGSDAGGASHPPRLSALSRTRLRPTSGLGTP